MKKYLLLSFCLFGAIGLSASERDENLKVILERTFLTPQAEPLLNMLAVQAASTSSKSLSASDVIAKFKETFGSADVLDRLSSPYEVFTDSDIAELKNIYESSVFQKFSKHSPQAIQKNFITLNEIFSEIVEKKWD